MRFTTQFTLLPLFLLSTYAATLEDQDSDKAMNCLRPPQAATTIRQFSSLLTSFNNNTARSLLSPTSFVKYSDSINFLSGKAQGAVTLPSAAAFIGGQGAQPPIAFQMLETNAVTCHAVIVFRWEAGVGPTNAKVRGINALNVALQKGGDSSKVGNGGWQIVKVFSDFDSARWVTAIGGSCVPPALTM